MNLIRSLKIALGVTIGIPDPTIVDSTPNDAPEAGGTPITIDGTNFQARGALVTIDGVACTSIVVVDAQTITCVTPALPAGLYDLKVQNLPGGTGGGLSATRFAYFTITPP
jgi:hypothetical protein